MVAVLPRQFNPIQRPLPPETANDGIDLTRGFGPVFMGYAMLELKAMWQTTRFQLDLSAPKVMGILNLTPDSFSDGGQLGSVRAAVLRAEQMLLDGAHILDVGGESTRPGAPAVPLDVELSRVRPVLQAVVKLGVPVSIDTYKPEVMQAALDLGVDIVNDIWALRQPGALALLASHDTCGVCLMHMHREPKTMQIQTMEGDVVPAVIAFLQERVQSLISQGVDPHRVVLDPGIGFGKTVAQNFSLLSRQSEIRRLGFPILAGWSRKSVLGHVIDTERFVSEPAQRGAASVAAALLAVERGASVVRVHDVKETVQALAVLQAMRRSDSP